MSDEAIFIIDMPLVLITTNSEFPDSWPTVNIAPIKQDKGMYVELSTFEKLKARFALSVKKKLHLAPSTAKVKTHRYIG